MRRFLLSVLVLFAASPALGQSCSALIKLRAASCPAGTSGVCSTKGSTLTWGEVDGAIGNVAELCTDSAAWLTIGGDLCGTASAPTVCADSIALGTDTTGGYAGSASEAGPATTALALNANPAACSSGQFVTDLDADGTLTCGTPAGGDHGGLTGLSDDDHAQYALLAGRSTGQTLIGGTGAGEDLTIRGTSNATAGSVIVSAGDLEIPAGAGTAPTLKFTGSDAGIAVSSNTLLLFGSGSVRGHVRGNGICAVNGSSNFACMANLDPSSTVPNIHPNGIFDPNTGLGWAAADQLSLISGGTEVQRLTTTGTLHQLPVREYTASAPPFTCDGTKAGYRYYDTDGTTFCGCNGSSWVSFDGGGACS